jgi:hypothetical protein
VVGTEVPYETLLRVLLGGAAAGMPYAVGAIDIILPINGGKLFMIVITFLPALVYLFAIRTLRGSLCFGLALLAIAGVSTFATMQSTQEFAGLGVIYGLLGALVLMIFGAAVDQSWRESA